MIVQRWKWEKDKLWSKDNEICDTGREEEINESVKAGRIQRTDKQKYLGIIISAEGYLKEHIK